MSAASAARIAEHVAQHQHGALPGRQALQPGHERQRERLPGLVAGLGTGRGVGQVVEERVRVGLQPQRLAPAGWARAGGSEYRYRLAVSGRRPVSRSAFRHRLVAILYSQARIEARSSNPSSPRQAASRVSCSMSSASWTEPRIR